MKKTNNLRINLSFRTSQWIQTIFCFCALVVAYYFEYLEELPPCALCLLERYFVFILGLLALFGLVFLKNHLAFQIQLMRANCFCALVGILISLRHTWLQYGTETAPTACLSGLNSISTHHFLLQVLQALSLHDKACGIIDATLWKLSLAAWSLVLFSGLFGLSVFVLAKKRRA